MLLRLNCCAMAVVHRPFGCGVMLAVWEPEGPKLYAVEPNGTGYEYYGCALGKAKQQAKTMIEVSRSHANEA